MHSILLFEVISCMKKKKKEENFNWKNEWIFYFLCFSLKTTTIITTQVGEGSSGTAQDEYDPRTLYERLQEQKNIKEELFQEQTRLSNLIKRVDDEEAEYYQTLSDVQERLNLEKAQKEQDELEAFRKCVYFSFYFLRFPLIISCITWATFSTLTCQL